MPTATLAAPVQPVMVTSIPLPMPHRFSVDDYHMMIQLGIFRNGASVELLEGMVVQKMSQDPPHATAVIRTRRGIERLVGVGWEVREEKPVTLSSSEPEPDVSVSQGNEQTFATRHPNPSDLALVVEVSDSTLETDRRDKARIYARDNIEQYWIVNIPDRQVEVYTQPSGPTATPGYADMKVYASGSSVPLVLRGVALGTIAVDELLP